MIDFSFVCLCIGGLMPGVTQINRRLNMKILMILSWVIILVLFISIMAINNHLPVFIGITIPIALLAWVLFCEREIK